MSDKTTTIPFDERAIHGTHPIGRGRRKPAGPVASGLDVPLLPVPDLAIQIKDLRPGNPPCFSDSDRTMLIQLVTSSLPADFFPAPDVRTACWMPGGVATAFTIAVWAHAPRPHTQDLAARDRATAALSVSGGAPWAVFLSASFIRRVASQAFANAPHRYDETAGTPDEGGAIHLTGIQVDFDADHGEVVTTISGYDDSPSPDVSFKLVVTDTLRSLGGTLWCGSKTEVDPDKKAEAYAIVEGILLGIGTLMMPYLIPLTGLVIANDLNAVGGHGTPSIGGAGCLATAMIPSDVPLPAHQRIVFNYLQPKVAATGVVYAGGYAEDARQPRIAIGGPTQLVADVKQGQTGALFAADPVETRGTVSYTWSGDMAINRPHDRTIAVVLPTRGAPAGSIVKHRIAVDATDADGPIPRATLDIEVHVVDQSNTSIPPVCLVKPWLPQCPRSPR